MVATALSPADQILRKEPLDPDLGVGIPADASLQAELEALKKKSRNGLVNVLEHRRENDLVQRAALTLLANHDKGEGHFLKAVGRRLSRTPVTSDASDVVLSNAIAIARNSKHAETLLPKTAQLFIAEGRLQYVATAKLDESVLRNIDLDALARSIDLVDVPTRARDLRATAEEHLPGQFARDLLVALGSRANVQRLTSITEAARLGRSAIRAGATSFIGLVSSLTVYAGMVTGALDPSTLGVPLTEPVALIGAGVAAALGLHALGQNRRRRSAEHRAELLDGALNTLTQDTTPPKREPPAKA